MDNNLEEYNQNIFYALRELSSGVRSMENDSFHTLRDTLSEAEALLTKPFSAVRPGHGDLCRLLSLGCQGGDPEEISKNLFRSLTRFLSQQSAAGDHFSVALSRRGEDLFCTLESPSSDQSLTLLRSSYNWAEAVPEHASTPPPGYRSTASIHRLPDSQDTPEKSIRPEDCVSWLDRVTAACLAADFRVEAVCVRIPDTELRQRREDVSKQHSRLSGYQENSWSIGSNYGSTKNGSLILASAGSNSGSSYQLSMKSEDTRIKQTLAALECEMKRLRTAVDAGGYQVHLSIQADRKTDRDTLRAILTGALRESGLSPDWSGQTGGCLSSLELCRVMQLPGAPFPGFTLHQNENSLPPPASMPGLALGKALFHGVPASSFAIPLEQFNRHAFVCGMTGSGKTNTVFTLLTRAGLPFVVIEPVKGEYRKLRRELPDLQIHTMSAGDPNALRLNPFWFPKGANLQYHIDGLKALIISSFSLTAAMPNIIEQCVHNIYLRRGWDTATGHNLYESRLPEDVLYPTFDDLTREVESYLARSGFVGETLATYQGALSTRLKSYTTGSKGLLLNVHDHPDFSQWRKGHVVLELDALSEDADKAIVMGSILLQYFQYLKLHSSADSKLLHMIVIEEAHRLFKNVRTGSRNAETADPQAQLVETLSNLMAEIRAYGEGVIVADQSPVKIAPDVVRNSNVKLVHRLDMGDDIQQVQNALLLQDAQDLLPALSCGQALVRFEGMQSPAKVLVSPYEGGTQAPPPERKAVSVTWNRSPIADSLLTNLQLRKRIDALAICLLRSVLYDDLRCINDWIRQTALRLQYLLVSFGYSQRECPFTSDVYNHLLLAGWNDAVLQNPLFGNHFSFCYCLQMLFERALRFFTENAVQPRESILLFHFRQTRIAPVLQEILQFSYSSYAEMLQACSRYVPYMELLETLAKLYEHRYPLSSAALEPNDLLPFLQTEIKHWMISPVSDRFLQECSQSLSALLKHRR